jgi:hypothetical protein
MRRATEYYSGFHGTAGPPGRLFCGGVLSGFMRPWAVRGCGVMQRVDCDYGLYGIPVLKIDGPRGWKDGIASRLDNDWRWSKCFSDAIRLPWRGGYSCFTFLCPTNPRIYFLFFSLFFPLLSLIYPTFLALFPREPKVWRVAFGTFYPFPCYV